MSSSTFFGVAELSYFLAMATYISYIAFRKNAIGVTATAITVFGFLNQSIAFIIRWVDSYHFWVESTPASAFIESLLRSAPLRNLYESLIFFVWSLILIHLIIEFIYKNRTLGAFVLPVAALALAFIDVSGVSTEIQPLIPALQSNWLLFHVLLSFLGYAAFGVSFGAAVAYLVMVTESRLEKSYIFWSIIVGVFMVVLIAMGFDYLSLSTMQRGELLQSYFLKATFRSASGSVVAVSWVISIAFIFVIWRFGLGLKRVLSALSITPNMLDDITYKSIAIGFPLFTIGGLIMGAIWANSAWGKYWTWDPKETWSLITWFVYALYLHARFVAGWRGKRVAILAVIGFVAVIFTYLGVNLVLSGLHSYGG
ncbi:cytochrome c biogenesis protein CcsA [bacterium BMS3Abin10]|nr:cytochrome c biogenesis protein CcsA [bacterium BMS3Abin10]GBE39366.1 cytochrome c biogenesis protein CcsA [bacterium BMS3Bbin08]HDH51290.1 c-type cytochrome biogenesis protein CcsB [Nitrospirota bacterium]